MGEGRRGLRRGDGSHDRRLRRGWESSRGLREHQWGRRLVRAHWNTDWGRGNPLRDTDHGSHRLWRADGHRRRDRGPQGFHGRPYRFWRPDWFHWRSYHLWRPGWLRRRPYHFRRPHRFLRRPNHLRRPDRLNRRRHWFCRPHQVHGPPLAIWEVIWTKVFLPHLPLRLKAISSSSCCLAPFQVRGFGDDLIHEGGRTLGQ